MSTTPEAHDRETDSYATYIFETLEGLIGYLDGLSEEQMNWRAPCEGANSLWVLAVHSLANAEQSILVTLGGAPDTRDREAEFRAQGTAVEALRARWSTLRADIQETIRGLSPEILDDEYTHPRRGAMTGREVLLLVIQHASEHRGHAGLTRDLLLAGQRHAG